MFEVLSPERKLPVGHIAVFPPATDYKKGFAEETRQWVAAGWAVLVARPVYLSPVAPVRGPQHPDGEAAFWRTLKNDIPRALTACRKQLGVSGPLVLCGFNLGGSVAASLVHDLKADALIAAGSIPRLSWFWLKSSHPVAAAARARGKYDEKRFWEIAAPFDLSASLSTIQVPTLIQIGRRDEWIELAEVDTLMQVAQRSARLQWLEDGHDMESPASLAGRLEFLRGIVPRPMVN